jgi:hypothetical protein
MNLSELARKPQLVEIKLDDEDTVTKYGEVISFWILDRQDIKTYAQMATIKPDDFQTASVIVQDLILDSKGKQIVNDENILPTDILMKAVGKVIEELGKLVTTQSNQATLNLK